MQAVVGLYRPESDTRGLPIVERSRRYRRFLMVMVSQSSELSTQLDKILDNQASSAGRDKPALPQCG